LCNIAVLLPVAGHYTAIAAPQVCQSLPWGMDLYVILRLEVEAAEEALSSALVTLVGGVRSPVSTCQVVTYLSGFFAIDAEGVTVHKYALEDFHLLPLRH
jgi:hypothetical protein